MSSDREELKKLIRAKLIKEKDALMYDIETKTKELITLGGLVDDIDANINKLDNKSLPTYFKNTHPDQQHLSQEEQTKHMLTDLTEEFSDTPVSVFDIQNPENLRGLSNDNIPDVGDNSEIWNRMEQARRRADHDEKNNL